VDRTASGASCALLEAPGRAQPTVVRPGRAGGGDAGRGGAGPLASTQSLKTIQASIRPEMPGPPAAIYPPLAPEADGLTQNAYSSPPASVKRNRTGRPASDDRS